MWKWSFVKPILEGRKWCTRRYYALCYLAQQFVRFWPPIWRSETTSKSIKKQSWLASCINTQRRPTPTPTVRGCVGAARMDSWESWTMESWLALINIKLFVRSCATSRISHSVWKNAQKRDPLLGVQKMAPQHNINLISSHAPDFSKPFWTPKVGPVFGFWAFLHPMQISVMQSCNNATASIPDANH